MHRILVTGANGFVGRHIIENLSRMDNIQVAAGMRHIDPDLLPNVRSNSTCVETIKFDLSCAENVAAVFEKFQPTHVINCAAYGVTPGNENQSMAFDTNVLAPSYLYELCEKHGVTRFVQIGTCAEYGPQVGKISETVPLNPVGVYAVSKAASSLLLLERSRTQSCELLILRLFNTWGKYEAAHRLIPSILRAAAKGETVPLSDGRQVRDFSYAPEIAQVINAITLVAHKLPHTIFNVGTGEGISVRKFAQTIAHEIEIDQYLDFGAHPMRAHEVPEQVADTTRLKDLLPNLSLQPIHSGQVRDFLHA